MRRPLANLILTTLAIMTAFPATAFAATDDALRQVYNKRPDLQRLFDTNTFLAIKSPSTAGLEDMVDWARQYGYAEYPNLLKEYAPVTSKRISARDESATGPVRTTAATFNFSKISANAVLVVDDATGETLLAKNDNLPHPIASITKLMTAMLVIDKSVSFNSKMTINKIDRVGGAQLRIAVGTPLPVRDVFNAMLIGSANDAAHALSRQCEPDTKTFVADMNAKAKELGLAATTFADPTGLELGNVSTPQDIVKMARAAFDYYDIRKTASTASYKIAVSRKDIHTLTNTNALLTNNKNGLVVLGGKTGYLNESRWNLVVRMHDGVHPVVDVVVFGAADKNKLFAEAEKAARWVWANYQWPTQVARK